LMEEVFEKRMEIEAAAKPEELGQIKAETEGDW